jgi:hypothetical protein
MNEQFDEIMPESCKNSWYNWELLHCMGCNKNEPNFVDHKTKTVWLCRKFVDRLYAKLDMEWDIDYSYVSQFTNKTSRVIDLSIPTKKFDRCGFLENKLTYTRDEEGNFIETESGQ